jgi:hypothetical protein
MTDPQHDREPAEHQRYAHYLQALDAVSEAEEAELVAAVLRDQDEAMAQGAVVHHLDRRAAQLLTEPDSPSGLTNRPRSSGTGTTSPACASGPC